MEQKEQIITFLGACYGTDILGSSPGRRTNQKNPQWKLRIFCIIQPRNRLVVVCDFPYFCDFCS